MLYLVYEFQEDVEAYLKKEGVTVDEALKEIEEKYRRYKYVEGTMAAQKLRLGEKLPEFQNSLAILEILIDKKVGLASFEVSFLQKVMSTM